MIDETPGMFESWSGCFYFAVKVLLAIVVLAFVVIAILAVLTA